MAKAGPKSLIKADARDLNSKEAGSKKQAVPSIAAAIRRLGLFRIPDSALRIFFGDGR